LINLAFKPIFTRYFLEFIQWMFSLSKGQRHLVKVVFDVALAPISLFAAFSVRLEEFGFLYLYDFYISCIVVSVSSVLVLWERGLYDEFTQHVSIKSAVTILWAATLSALCLLILKYSTNIWLPLSIPLIYATILCLLTTSSRFFIRVCGQALAEEKRQNIAIYGAGVEGAQLLNALSASKEYKVCAFIDDTPELHGRRLAGVPINNFEATVAEFEALNINLILIVERNLEELTRKRLSHLLLEQKVTVKTIPSMSDIISSSKKNLELQNLDISNLLGRPQVHNDVSLLSKSIYKKTLLVTGAGGSIGGELSSKIANWKPQRLILLDISELGIFTLLRDLETRNLSKNTEIIPLIGSVRDSNFISSVLANFQVDTIFHAAAHKHVSLMEMNMMQCISNNVIGTHVLVEQAVIAKVPSFVFVSTDKAVNPTNIMGASKRIGELICQYYGNEHDTTRFSIVRFGNVLGSSGSVVPIFEEQIKKLGPVTVSHEDVTRYFMTIPEAAELVIQAGAMTDQGGVFVLDMGDPIKIMDLAKKMIALSGSTPVYGKQAKSDANHIKIITTGLKPGEKLHEELSYCRTLVKTEHPRIMRAENEPTQFHKIPSLLRDIQTAINARDTDNLLKTVSLFLDRFRHTNESDDSAINLANKN